MQILLSAYAVSPARGSEPGVAWQLTEQLSALGHEVTLLTTHRFADEHVGPAYAMPRLTIVYVNDQIPRLLNHGQVGVYLRYVTWQRRSLRRARTLMRASPESVTVAHHCSWAQLNTGSPLASLSIPFVFGPVAGATVTPRAMMSLLTPSERVRERLRTAAVRAVRWNIAARRVVRRSAIALAANTDAERAISQLGGNPRVLMPECLPPHWFATPVRSRPNKGTSILWVGRAMPRKALSLAIMTLVELPDQFTLRVAGDGPKLSDAQQLAVRLGVSERVTFLGSVPWAQLVEEYDGADLLLFTSARDSFGIQVLEAASRGLPTVGIRHQGVGDHLPADAGVLVPLNPPAVLARSLAAAIKDLARDEALRRRLGEGARAFAEAHTSGRLASEVVKAYEEAIELCQRVGPPSGKARTTVSRVAQIEEHRPQSGQMSNERLRGY